MRFYYKIAKDIIPIGIVSNFLGMQCLPTITTTFIEIRE